MSLNVDPGVSGAKPPPLRRTSLPTIAAVVVVLGALYFGRQVFLPLAIALLVTFALAPVVSAMRRIGIPRIPAVIATVSAAFALVAIFALVVVMQVGVLAENISLYQSNILGKIVALREAGANSGIIERLSGVVENVGRELEKQEPPDTSEPAEPEPLPVEVVSSQRPIEVLRSLIGPLVSPLATTGLIVVVVIFMLVERESLRDRFIRLAGYSDLHRTTEALQDAGRRVGRYLLMQLVVNITYAVPIAAGLWFLGIPNALLWGLLALVLRFVPYIGPVIAALLPLFLAFAVAPGWTLVLWTAGLFIAMELISNNFVEPWLYGSRTGLSPLAVIVAAIFWTWMWGPIGLVLSTPLTVCLVVLGRHVPQFEFLDVLLGDEPVLEPHERLYQRLLAGDPVEATDHAVEILEEQYLVDFYGSVAIPALLLGENDRKRGVLAEEQRRQVARSALALVANLEGVAREEGEEAGGVPAVSAAAEGGDGAAREETELPDGTGKKIVCAGGRGELDDAAAAMLAQVLEVQGAEAKTASFVDLDLTTVHNLQLDAGMLVVGFLNRSSVGHARYLIRRLKRSHKGLRVGIVFWSEVDNLPEAEALRRTAQSISADFVAADMTHAVLGALSDAPVVPLAGTKKVRLRKPARRPATKAAAKRSGRRG